MAESTTVAGVVRAQRSATPGRLAFVEGVSGDAMTWREYDERSSSVRGALGAYEPRRPRRLQLADGPDVHAVMLGMREGRIRRRRDRRARGCARGRAPRRAHRRARAAHRRRRAAAALADERPLAADELWFLNSTSGTTGLPKIVMHDQARWFAFHELAQRVAHFDPDDVFLSALPAPFGFGLWTAHFTPAIVGAPCVVLAQLLRRGRARARSSGTGSRCSPRCRRSS